jgi:hypothetical protein
VAFLLPTGFDRFLSHAQGLGGAGKLQKAVLKTQWAETLLSVQGWSRVAAIQYCPHTRGGVCQYHLPRSHARGTPHVVAAGATHPCWDGRGWGCMRTLVSKHGVLPPAGMTDAFVWDAGTPRERLTGPAETQQLLDELDSKFRRECTHLIYHHKVGCPPGLHWVAAHTACVPHARLVPAELRPVGPPAGPLGGRKGAATCGRHPAAPLATVHPCTSRCCHIRSGLPLRSTPSLKLHAGWLRCSGERATSSSLTTWPWATRRPRRPRPHWTRWGCGCYTGPL